MRMIRILNFWIEPRGALWSSARRALTLAIGLASVTWAVPSSAGDPPAPKCSLKDGPQTLTVDGQERQYVVAFGPVATRDKRNPVLLVWHGLGGSGRGVVSLISGPDWPEAIRIAPQGLPRTFRGHKGPPRRGWQVRSGEYNDRDLAFFDALIGQLRASGCVDPAQVYSTGFSNGAFFSHLLACVRPRYLAAVAPVGGGGPFEACRAQVPILIHHGTDDPIVSYDRAKASFEAWRTKNGCKPATLPVQGCISAPACAQPLKMCVASTGHRWPGGAAARIAEFFKSRSSTRKTN